MRISPFFIHLISAKPWIFVLVKKEDPGASPIDPNAIVAKRGPLLLLAFFFGGLVSIVLPLLNF